MTPALNTAFDPTKTKLTATCEVPGILFALGHDAQQGKLYGAGTDWSVYCVNVNDEKLSAEKRWTNHENYVTALAFLDGIVISASYDRRIIWTDAETGEQIRAVDAHGGWIRDLTVFPDNLRMASVGDDMLVKIWDTTTGELLATLAGHAKQTPQGYATALYTLAITPDNKFIASGDRIGKVCLWEVDTGKLVRQLDAPTFYTYDPRARVRSIGGIRSISFSPDGSTLAIAGIGQVTNVDGFVGPCRVELWDWRSGKHTLTCHDKHKAVLNHVAFHSTEPYLIAAGGGDSGGILAIWDQKKVQPVHKTKPKGHIQRLVVDSVSPRLFMTGHEGFQFWSFGTE